MLRISPEGNYVLCLMSEKYFSVNLNNGNLYIADRLDRETLCRAAADCALTFDAVVENPLNIFNVKIDIQDINDNAPKFIRDTLRLELSEYTLPGAKKILQKAEDLDVGVNSVISYRLSENQYFALGEKVSTDGSVFPELILEKPLDRETQNKHELILTASDGGNPVQTGTALINIIITDFNDNSPVFTQDVYKVSVRENIPVNSTILQVSASDEDEGVNAQITYSFSTTESHILEVFTINPQNGEIKTKEHLDYEKNKYYEILVEAKDGGGLAAHAKVLIEITDENDNAPEISITSSSDNIPEDSPPGTMVALVKVHDRDSRENGEVQCIITVDLPFELISSGSNFFKIVTKRSLDREKVSSYNITIQASDKGSPEMTSRKVIRLDVSDVNDNAPVFEKLSYTVYITENNSPGASLFSVQARDIDREDNAKITYSIVTRSDEDDPLSSYISMNPVTGVIYAQKSFDYEKNKEFNIQIIARDNGSPSLNSSTTLRISIVDQNDNLPVILYPSPEVESCTFEMVPWTSEQGSLVSKVVAVDADSGHNAWLSYFLQSPEPSLFTIDQHTGEIRTSRGFHEKDIMKHGIGVLVKDNGIPSRSASVTLTMVIADHFHQVLPELGSQSNKEESQSNLQFYLVIALALISFFFMLTVIIAVVSKYKESKSTSTFGSLSASLYPQIDPRFLPQFNTGTLPLPYSYDVCVTLDPSEQEFAFVQPQHNVPVDSLIDADDSGIGNQSLKNFSGNPMPEVDPRCISQFNPGTLPLPFSYDVCVTLDPSEQEFPFLKPPHNVPVDSLIDADDSGIRNEALKSSSPPGNLISQQGQPNTDWRFTQAQRPGPSGAQQPTEEAGVWPNNQFETERLQAMILASANEAAEGSSAVGPGAGTMGLSARYGPQFTLQHVPDYRQNIYIPGTTSTLTNAAGKRDGKAGAPSGNKKKSGKKEKK
ncbi:LOW QUALITY PROTEIN: protocadherin gamma-B1-like [Anomaloglossus baeobatrachus]